MLVNLRNVSLKADKGTPDKGVPFMSVDNGEVTGVNSDEKLHKVLGAVEPGKTKHFWSHGTFNSVRLLFHVLNQVGPSEVIMSTYSISEKSARQLWAAKQKGLITDIRFIIDNRVRSMSPKPFQALTGFFPGCVRTASIHAKVTLIKNANAAISIVSSMNATDNSKIERGLISTDRRVYDFDFNVMNHEFNRAST